MISFQERDTEYERDQKFNNVMNKRTGYVPTILVRGSLETPLLHNEKYMIPQELNGAQLNYIIMRRMRMKPSQSLFLVCDRRMIIASDVIFYLYNRFKNNNDGYLYITYTVENVFG